MGGLMRFILGGVLGAVLGLFLSRSRVTTTQSRPASGTEGPAAAAPFMESPGAAAAVADAIVDLGPETELPDPASVVDWTESEGWPEFEQGLADDNYSVFEWTHEDSSDESSEAPAAFALGAALEPVAGAEPTVTLGPTKDLEPMVGPASAAGMAAAATSHSQPVTGKPPISAEELRARIEESRRRIRQELEQPFAPSLRDTEAHVEAGHEGVSAKALEASPEPSDVTLGPRGGESEGALNYDIMKARIEETRSRLKAQALEAHQAVDKENVD